MTIRAEARGLALAVAGGEPQSLLGSASAENVALNKPYTLAPAPPVWRV